jgi:hypothetical protein
VVGAARDEEDPMAQPTPPEGARDRSPFWPWLLVLLVALAAGVLLAWHPWTASQAREPQPTVSGSPSDPGTPEPTGSATATPTVAGGFDAGSAADLFLTDAELAEAVPDAAGSSLAEADEARWGLPTGSRVSPPECTPAVTVVEQEPAVFQRRFASAETVTVIQSVMVLADATAAADAFDVLVATLGRCEAYEQSNPGVDGGAWTAEQPTTASGEVSTVVRRMSLTAEGATSPEVEVTALAGNALVMTTVSGVDSATAPADPGVLAGVARSSAQRALDALD